MSAHTPTPWYCPTRTQNRPKNGYRFWIAEVATFKVVASVDTLDADEREANAEFIVRACNAHDDLLAALETLLDRMTDGRNEMSRGELEENAELIRAAIAKAQP